MFEKKISLSDIEVIESILNEVKSKEDVIKFKFNDITKANVHLLDLINARDRFELLVKSAACDKDKKIYLWNMHYLNMRINEVNKNIDYLQLQKDKFMRVSLNVGQVKAKEV